MNAARLSPWLLVVLAVAAGAAFGNENPESALRSAAGSGAEACPSGVPAAALPDDPRPDPRSAGEADAFYVAPEGSDGADGGLTHPFATLARARAV